MHTKKMIVAVASVASVMGSFGSGFALYEPSAISHAMGGALVGKAMDASANVNNPATLTDLENIQFSLGFVTEHPRGTMGMYNNGNYLGTQKVDPGLFWLPHFQLAVPLPYDFAFGLSVSAEYGLGTKYGVHSPTSWNSTETTVQGLVINPNLAYKITKDWSIGAGIRWLYFDFEQYKTFDTRGLLMNQGYPGAYLPAGLGSIRYHMKGDNRFDSLGWQVGTKYDILDNLSVGVVYKAPIPVDVRGDAEAHDNGHAMSHAASSVMNGGGGASLTLPQSVTAGINWDVTETWHLGVAESWTQWSEIETIIFRVPPARNPVKLNWNDTWRTSIGSAWDFAEDWTWMVSYVFDMDCGRDGDQDSNMLPPADRHIVGTGFTWRCWAGLEFTISYACIFMDGHSMYTSDRTTATGDWTMETKRGFCHAGGFSLTYRF